MKKIIFSLIASSAIFYSGNAQTKISFESAEGYNAGPLNNQKTWTAWGNAPANYTSVSTTKASDGTQAAKITGNGLVGDSYGIESTVSSSYNKTVVTYDINVDQLNGSDNFFALYADGYLLVAAVDFEYTGIVSTYDSSKNGLVDTPKSYVANTWYSVKMDIDFTTHVVKYYVNSQLVGTGTINPILSKFGIIDLMTDDYGTSFNIDNIQIADATLATSEVSKKDVLRIYPNPTADVVNFDVDGKIISVEIYDAAGKLVKTTKDGAKSLNISELNKGNYIVKIQTDKVSHTQKLIKK